MKSPILYVFLNSISQSMGKRPPAPLYIIRSHESSISKVSFNRNSDCILSADDDGVVVITSTKTMRSSRRWKAHESAVLTLEITVDHLLTQVIGLLLCLLLTIAGMAGTTW
ncbi:hypothetical protein E3Q18_01758 [Wallemia mellicola]|nr:hypothetical protein E3Q18_01758 [Wallemia mellicola]